MPATIPAPAAAQLDHGTHYHAHAWKITRADATVLRFTDHDAALSFGGATYTPGGFDASARRADGGLEVHSFQIDGLVASGEITVADLRAGRYDEASVTEYLLDWRFPWLGAIRERQFWIDAVSFDGERWSAETSGLARFLRRPVGKFLSRTCYWKLFESFGVSGVAGCKVDPASYTFTPVEVDVVLDARRQFSCAAGDVTGALGEDYFADGKVTWLTGDNAGTTFEVATHPDHATGLYTLSLHTETDFDIAAGDTFTLTAGCDKTFATCKAKFSNAANFGGAENKPHAGDILKIGKGPQS